MAPAVGDVDTNGLFEEEVNAFIEDAIDRPRFGGAFPLSLSNLLVFGFFLHIAPPWIGGDWGDVTKHHCRLAPCG
jgi:hypothetical protein